MKKFLTIAAIAGTLVACNNDADKTDGADTTTTITTDTNTTTTPVITDTTTVTIDSSGISTDTTNK